MLNDGNETAQQNRWNQNSESKKREESVGTNAYQIFQHRKIFTSNSSLQLDKYIIVKTKKHWAPCTQLENHILLQSTPLLGYDKKQHDSSL